MTKRSVRRVRDASDLLEAAAQAYQRKDFVGMEELLRALALELSDLEKALDDEAVR